MPTVIIIDNMENSNQNNTQDVIDVEMSEKTEEKEELIPNNPASEKTERVFKPTEELVVFSKTNVKPVYPWIKLDGKTNHSFFSNLKRTILDLILHNPGVYQKTVLSKINVFRPAIIISILDTFEVSGIVYSKWISYSKPSLFSTPEATMTYASNEALSFQDTTRNHEKCYFPTKNCLHMLEEMLEE